jgi:hypothetical protein
MDMNRDLCTTPTRVRHLATLQNINSSIAYNNNLNTAIANNQIAANFNNSQLPPYTI